MAILYPTSLANLVVEVGTRHCHQTLLDTKEHILKEILFENQKFSLTKIFLKILSAKWWPYCFGLNVLMRYTDFTRLLGSHFCALNPEQNGHHSTDAIFKCHFVIRKAVFLYRFLGGPTDNKSTWVHVMQELFCVCAQPMRDGVTL